MRLTAWLRSLLLALVGLGALSGILRAQPADRHALFERVRPAVAVVRTFSEGRRATGTAFFIQPHVALTAAHVVRGRDQIFLEPWSGGEREASLVGYDARRDVAVVRTNGAPLPFLELVDSAGLRPGDPVAVIGSPRGRPITLATGHVLATGATLPGLVPGILIRTSVPLVPGHSGSPLVNLHGQVVGLVIAVSNRPGEEGGLAVASAVVRQVLPELLGGIRRERAWIGIVGMTLGPELALRRGFPVRRGVLILDVVPHSPAEAVGLRADRPEGPPGDVIVSADGREITQWEDLLLVLGDREPGQRLRLGIARGGERLQVEVVLAARP
ncbi:MAG: trypsin-like peptidase domain-containing protein [Armatimonadota bacterium]|nr:trypsin-like peptidase domain-containing protein [Armatimonadota bacterium]MDR7438718.1 trypsin-like peptidase domain-containing protein [Armatimonadota bacterium]MDR7561934.1 trypsin-like peptidase domain-containing protein [Armatimonadota bacterium]MDR7567507.1 trypsin-like peptidase domain-containing protein [Armatimonadota bacterium]MDR7601845.1 trypsin-like peptidase domain-containing protein [Armatimonadota bacterium]